MLNNLQELLLRASTLTIVILVLCLVVFVVGVCCAVLLVKVNRLSRRLTSLTRNSNGDNLELSIAAQVRAVDDAIARADALEHAVGILQAKIPTCLQRVKLVRYDAFDDVGGEQSFAVALLDGKGDGVLLSSIYTRQDVRIYAKSISEGVASHSLSDEEIRALGAH